MSLTVLLSAPYMLPFVDRFKPQLEGYGLNVIVPEVHERLGEEEILAYAGQFDATICGDDRYTPRVLQACAPRLKVISKWGTGIDSIDREAAAALGIQVRNTPNAFTLPVSDSVLGYILSFARRLPWMDRAMKDGVWQKLPGRSLSECTLGVIGVGNVGKAVLRRARAFGLKLLGNDIAPIAPDFILENGIEMVSLPELLSRADFISVNCDLNPTSRHLINPQTLALVKPGAVLINTARGPIVDEPALIAALQEGRLAGAALDVFEVEPLPLDSPLLKMDQVMLAAHNSNSSPAAWERVHLNTIKNLLEGLCIPA
ncbi:MAG TPA: phosphoglycerate dehydrogenase [Anaerolineaceae bacterium]|nr:phosphoglycerate dehydrogenase [Anaerolineaceae bacterium]HPN53346.1 phosphoglycerate dehydrogenase [Anaerolineaceae bacterium]